jgi:peptidoglycan-N-acetylglucosamine deacetylase
MERVSARGQAVLTFDDGPDLDATPAVLDALDKAGAQATFFVVGDQVLRNGSLTQEISNRGHEVALHGYDHHRHDKLEPAQSRADVIQGFEAIEQATGLRCSWYRPPFGRMTAAAAEACEELGMKIVYWSAWGLDWESVSAGRIAEVVGGDLNDGAILLLHDSARYGRRSSALPTAQAIPLIADQAAARGISLVSLDTATAA